MYDVMIIHKYLSRPIFRNQLNVPSYYLVKDLDEQWMVIVSEFVSRGLAFVLSLSFKVSFVNKDYNVMQYLLEDFVKDIYANDSKDFLCAVRLHMMGSYTVILPAVTA